MRGLGHRVQLGLLLAAVFVPSAVLVMLGLRVLNQDRELRLKRQTDEQKRVLAEAGSKLRAVLERITADEARGDLDPGQGYRHAETIFVGWSEEGKLVLPWEPERDRAAIRCRELFSEPQFDSTLRACERAGRSGDGTVLADCYARAVSEARHPLQAAYARWQLAEALTAAGQQGRARELLISLLDTGVEFADADGIPLKLLASQALLAAGAHPPQIAAALDAVLLSRPWLSPVSLLVVAEVAGALARAAGEAEEKRAAEVLQSRSAAQVRLIDEAQSLQSDFPQMRSSLKGTWIPYGNDLWLVGADGDVESRANVFVVRGSGVLRSAAIAGAERLADSRDSAGEFIGHPFPGLKLVMSSSSVMTTEPVDDNARRLFVLLLLLVTGVTIFAAYLLWRDLRREVRASDLRAQFVSSVSHELKTPLTAIRMFAETLQMGRCVDERTQQEYLGTIVNECERLSRLVDGVLLFSRTEQGKKHYRLRLVEAAEAVRAAAKAMEYPLSQHGFRLHVDIQEDTPPISADRDAIEQAVLNLLSNAIKFSGDARDVELAVHGDKDEVVIRVTDHGVGIAPHEQSRIFEKFYRVATPQNQLIPGTGLGLTLVAQIAHAHGGRVTVESALGKGSTFSLRLPAQPRAAADREETYERHISD